VNFTLAQPSTTNTVYSKGVFTTTVSGVFEGSQQTVNQTINKFISEYSGNLQALFGWALKGLKLQGEKDGFIEFNIKSHTPENQIIIGKMDIAVKLMGKQHNNVAYKVKIEKTKTADNLTEISYHLYDCEEVISSAKATLTITKLESNTYDYKLVVRTTLTKFYNALMSRKMFRENIEWRFSKLTDNLIKDIGN
jgi:hypothetical protein